MKKSLLALAAMGAFAGAAQAQSSVTVYGILDMGYVGTNARNSQTSSTALASKNTTSAFGASAETTSRLGFRGTEDLGGGTRAFFTAEFGLWPTDANLSGNANAGLFNRQTFVGLGQKGLGQFAVGTQYTPMHLAVGATDPGQQNNMIGSIIYAVSSGTGSTQTQTAYTVRQNNALTIQTDRMAGFRVGAMYSLNNRDQQQYASGNTSTTAGGNTNVNGWGIGVDFQWQKLFVTGVYQSFKNESDNATANYAYPTTNSGSALPTAASSNALAVNLGTTPWNGINVTDNQIYAAATYDFGVLKAYVNYINRKATSTINSNLYVSRTGQQIGVRGFATKTIEYWGNIGTGRYQAFGSGEPTANFNAWQLGSNYWLSKRTNLYAIYGQTQTSNATLSTTYSPSYGASSYAVGVRHTF